MDVRISFSNRWTHGLGWGLTALYVLAHFLVLVALVAFGLRAGGWALPPLAVAWYGLFVLGSVAPLIQARRPEGSHWLLVVPALLALALMGAFGVSQDVGRAVYGPYDPGDTYRVWAVLQVWAALILTALAALYRWPSLALAGLLAQAALTLTGPQGWANLLLWGWPTLIEAAVVLLFVAFYGLALWALNGWPSGRWKALLGTGVSGAVGAAIALLARLLALGERGVTPSGFLYALLGALALGGLGLFSVALGAPSLKPAETGRRFPAEASAFLLWGASTLTLAFARLAPEGALPRPGTPSWSSPGLVVPAAWLPALGWAEWLLKALRWAAAPYALLGLATALLGWRRRPAMSGTSLLLMGVGVALTALFPLGLFLPYPRVAQLPDYTLYYPDWLLSLPVGVLLILAGRATTVHPAARWEERARPLGRAVALGLLLFGLWYAATMGALHLRTASWPGALVYLAFFALGLLAAGWLLAAWWRTDRDKAGIRLLGTLALLAAGVGGLLALTWPRVVSTVPPNGAAGVPRNTQVEIRMRPSWLEGLPGNPGVWFFAYYADTGQRIQGGHSFWEDGFFLSPEGPLRPDAPVEVVVRRGWERPYRLRFTTAGPDSPTATPMPTPAHPIGPVPTALPTATP